MTSSDDEYKGYFIPKGTVIIGSAWQVASPVVFSATVELTHVQGDPS
jgi:hypothetical protein